MVDATVNLDGDAGEGTPTNQEAALEEAAPVMGLLGEAPKESETGVIGPGSDPASNETQKNEHQESEKPAAVETPAVETPAVETPAVETPNEEYELEVSADSALSEEALQAVAAEAGELGLNKVQATALLKSREEAAQSAVTVNTMSQQNAANQTALLAMPEFSTPETRQESLTTIGQVIDTFGDSAEMREYLRGPAGNSPHLAKMLLQIGNSMKSDTFVGKGKIATTPTEKSSLEKMYPSFYKD